MDGGSRDIGEVSKQRANFSSQMSRRKFLGVLVGTAAVIATGNALRSGGEPKEVAQNPAKFVSQEPSLSASEIFASKLDQEKKDIFEQTRNNPLFKNCNEVEKIAAFEEVLKHVDHYRGHPLFSKVKLEGRAKATLAWSGLVDKCFKEVTKDIEELGYTADPIIKEMLLPLIYVESSGDSNEISNKKSKNKEEKARGLCQILPKTGRQIAKLLGIPFQENNLMDPETNIKFSMVYLGKLLHDYVDPGIAFWTYHLGESNMPVAIGDHIQLDPKITPADFKEVDDKLTQISKPPGSAYLVKKYNLNFVKLASSNAFVNKLKKREAYGDDTQYYVPRIAAAGILLNTYKSKT